MSGFYNYDTRGASQADQIINLEHMVEKLERENAALREERDALRRDAALTADKLSRQHEAIKELTITLHEMRDAWRSRAEEAQQKIDSLRRDTERYRWLRDVGDSTWEPMAKRVPEGAAGIDAAIDAAMEGKHE